MKLKINEIIAINKLIEREKDRITSDMIRCEEYNLTHPDEPDEFYNWESDYYKEERENLQTYRNISYKINNIEI